MYITRAELHSLSFPNKTALPAILLITGVLVILALAVFFYKKKLRLGSVGLNGHFSNQLKSSDNRHTNQVGAFYDQHNDSFLKVYGNVIQAFRTTRIDTLLDAQARSMGLKKGMRLLDAGCGVCGPAIYFARNFGVHIDAVSASEKQVEIAKRNIEKEELTDLISVRKADYHQLESNFSEGSYDVVYFLESFGHSSNKAKAVNSAWRVLKQGGLLFIKDLFEKQAVVPAHKKQIRKNIDDINKSYRYQVADLTEIIDIVRKKGFILSSVKTVDIPLEEFENLSISNDFQELTGINRINSLQDYLFPVDFFEISCIRPWYDLSSGNNRYFLQNLYHLQVLQCDQKDL